MYFQLEGKKFMDSTTRRPLMYAMSILATSSLVLFLFLRPISKENLDKKLQKETGPVDAFKKTWTIFTSRDIRVLLLTFCYTGMFQNVLVFIIIEFWKKSNI